MKTNLENGERLQAIQHDCGLIMEAIRRLIDGTWGLGEEDQSYSWELFPKIRNSLCEHVLFEEEAVFPNLNAADRKHHRADHGRLFAQLWAVEMALSEMKAGYFQDLLRGLYKMLQEHHKDFAPVLKGIVCHAEENIFNRSEKNVL